MGNTPRILLLTAAAALAGTACGGSAPSATVTVTAAPSAASTAPSPSTTRQPDTGTTDGSPFTCSTVVDSADTSSPFKVVRDGGSLTAQQAIAYLEALLIADGVTLSAGQVNATAAAILDGTGQDLENYHLDKLAGDAQQFRDDEQSYNPVGPVDASSWPAVQADILALGKDCPKAMAQALRIDRGGSAG